jgi:hypothetical protein
MLVYSMTYSHEMFHYVQSLSVGLILDNEPLTDMMILTGKELSVHATNSNS